jgi:hypothetical protein
MYRCSAAGEYFSRAQSSLRRKDTSNAYRSLSTDPQSDVARARSWAAIYVQDFDAPCVLQFAWISALCCALHRSTSQVIHRSGSYISFVLIALFFHPPLAFRLPANVFDITSIRTSSFCHFFEHVSSFDGGGSWLTEEDFPFGRTALNHQPVPDSRSSPPEYKSLI